MPNISIFRLKRCGLKRKACFLSTSNSPGSGSPLYICFVQINYVKAKNRTTLLELPGFVFGADAAAPLFFLNTVLCRVLVP